jgi:hypothetical protein
MLPPPPPRPPLASVGEGGVGGYTYREGGGAISHRKKGGGAKSYDRTDTMVLYIQYCGEPHIFAVSSPEC